jgi:hypothetical protein
MVASTDFVKVQSDTYVQMSPTYSSLAVAVQTLISWAKLQHSI